MDHESLLRFTDDSSPDGAGSPDSDGPPPAEGASADARLIALDEDTRRSIQILVVDDDATLRRSCVSLLEMEGYTVSACGRGDEALQLLKRKAFDVVLLDLYMSQVPGLDLLDACMERHPDALVIVMTGKPSLATSIQALRQGAWDYMPKPFSATQLQILVGRAGHAVAVARESRAQQSDDEDAIPLLGDSDAFKEALRIARQVAATDASVFLSGESGTGKELIAQYIHLKGRRSSRPLVALNCAALPDSLLESEMFGHTVGAFTGAVRDKPGLLEAANGGTLFLDEITEMSAGTQAKLLRVIQDGVVRRLGSNTTDAVVNVRFIAATNRDPAEAIREGLLRADLYYRLRVVPIRMPALRERSLDVPLLAEHFLQRLWQRHRRGDGKPPRLTDAAIQALQGRPWPGNVRELQNVMEHAAVMLAPDSEVLPKDLPSFDEEVAPVTAGGLERLTSETTHWNEPYHDARERLIGEFERSYLTWLVGTAAAGNMSRAARIAGVDRTTLYRLLEKHGMQRDTVIRQARDED